MLKRAMAVGVWCLLSASSVATAADWQEHPQWGNIFDMHDAQGTLAVLDARNDEPQYWVHNQARAETRLAPASTFKIPHTLFALDAGVVEDEFEIIPWDGTERDVPAWNHDQTLRSAMRNSTVWVYQGFARDIGEEAERQYLERTDYGNAKLGDDLETFWLGEGELAISAAEQLAFLQRLYRYELPFEEHHQRLVTDMMINEAGRDWILRAKTGWDGQVGWWVGWVDLPEGPVFFAINIDTPNRMADLSKRDAIAREALQSLQALPSASSDS